MNPSKYTFSNGISKSIRRVNLSLSQIRKHQFFQSIYNSKNECDVDIKCDICLIDTSCDTDLIVICDLCLVAVHQSCYGRELLTEVPKNDWYCAIACTHLLCSWPVTTFPTCPFCPITSGVLIPAPSFVHVVCVNWILGLSFSSSAPLSIKGKPRNKIECEECKLEGAGVKCEWRGCGKGWHVICAMKAGVIKRWDEMKIEGAEGIPVFCRKHDTVVCEIIKVGRWVVGRGEEKWQWGWRKKKIGITVLEEDRCLDKRWRRKREKVKEEEREYIRKTRRIVE